MKLHFYTLIVSAALFTCCTAPEVDTVHLKGQLINMGTNQVTLSYDGAASMIGDTKNMMLTTDENGFFDTILTIKEPAYYQIYRNTLYLTPGDDMTIKITPDNQEAEFDGKGAEVNNYMKFRLFPKGGSYLEGGSNVRESYEETKILIDSLAKIRIEELNALKEATEKFKELELARIKADIANSYLSFISYASMKKHKLKIREEYALYADSIQKIAEADAQPILKELNQDQFMDVAVVRDIMRYAVKPRNEQTSKMVEGITISPYMDEMYKAAGYANKLRGNIEPELFDEINRFIEIMNYPEFAEELKAKLLQAGKLIKGQLAIDFKMKDVEGNTHKLSDFKGKVIYLDFWATWCGPCIQESPHFEKLAKEMKGKDIVFISVSTDKNQKEWIDYITTHKKELTQYNSTDIKLDLDWAIYYIPRFVIIDKEFKIVDAYAPRPSAENIKSILELLAE